MTDNPDGLSYRAMLDEEQIQTAFRLPVSLLKRVEAYGRALEERNPGVRVSRTDAVRSLLDRALSDFERETKGKRGK